MDHNAHTYAHALARLAREEKKDAPELARRFVAFMQSRGHQNLIPAVLNVFEALEHKELEARKVRIRIAHQADRDVLAQEIEQAVKDLGAEKKSEERVYIDSSLIGGFIVEKGGSVLDKSFKRDLITLYNQLMHTHHG